MLAYYYQLQNTLEWLRVRLGLGDGELEFVDVGVLESLSNSSGSSEIKIIQYLSQSNYRSQYQEQEKRSNGCNLCLPQKFKSNLYIQNHPYQKIWQQQYAMLSSGEG